MSIQGQLNRLLGISGVDAQRAANELAGTSGKELLFALNQIAGTAGKGIVFVMNRIAQLNAPAGEVGIQGEEEAWESNYDPVGSLELLGVGSIVPGGYDTAIVGFSSSFWGEYMAFYDTAGVQY